ncbi:MAG TPA: PaaI family thioesterase [Thermoanaerobaculia bacterium]|nr:PaaI family thioesterase [Thermoanaerobaculia bacterium]
MTRLLGVRPVSLGEGEARIEMTAGEHLHNAMGTLHGGIFCDLADIAIGAALATVTVDRESFTTLELHMSYPGEASPHWTNHPESGRRPVSRLRGSAPQEARAGIHFA